MREMEDQYTNSAINLPSNTINIILEFTQPETRKVSENGVLPEETGDQLVQVAYCSSVSNNNPDVTAEISSTAGSEFSTTDNVTRKPSQSNVVEQIKRFVAERNSPSSNSIEPSILNVQQPSIFSNPQHPLISNPQQPLISNQQWPSISNLQQPSISNPQQPSISTPQGPSVISNPQELSIISNPQQQAISNAQVCTPSTFNLYIQNKEVVQRTLNIQTQGVCQEKTANKRQQRVKEITSANNNCHKTVEATQCSQITSSTKLALLNFLKKKYTGNISVANAETEQDNVDPEMRIVSTVEQESNGSGKEGSCSDETCNAENDVVKVATSTVSQEIASFTESSCTNPVQLSQNSDNSPGGQLTSTAAQSDNADQPLINQSDVSMMNADIDKERKTDDNNSSILTKVLEIDNTTSDVALCSESTHTIQEVDVVVLPSLLQPKQSCRTTKKAAKRPDGENQQGTGVKKKKKRKPRECKECGKILASATTYIEHMNIHYDRRPYKCDECGKSFRQRHHIAQHKLVHSGKKPYVCQYCDKAFARRYNKRDHERIHTGEKPCKCHHCGKMFRCARGLKEHEIKVHHLHSPARNNLAKLNEKKKVYTCIICSKTFSWSSALSTHKKLHMDVWGYKCPKCKKPFKNKSSLWNHVRTHSKEKPFECDICGQRLKRRGNLKRHILTQHDPEEAEECLKTSKEFVHLRAKKTGRSDLH